MFETDSRPEDQKIDKKQRPRGDRLAIVASLVMVASMGGMLKNAWDATKIDEKAEPARTEMHQIYSQIGDPLRKEVAQAYPDLARQYSADMEQADKYFDESMDQWDVAIKWAFGGSLSSMGLMIPAFVMRNQQRRDNESQISDQVEV